MVQLLSSTILRTPPDVEFPACTCFPSGLLSSDGSAQGLEDEIVPPNQAELMYNQLKDRGIPTALVLFAGEQHGFRQATNIR